MLEELALVLTASKETSGTLTAVESEIEIPHGQSSMPSLVGLTTVRVCIILPVPLVAIT